MISSTFYSLVSKFDEQVFLIFELKNPSLYLGFPILNSLFEDRQTKYSALLRDKAQKWISVST